jgi:hypothetical protein
VSPQGPAADNDLTDLPPFDATELRLAPDLAALVATRRFA